MHHEALERELEFQEIGEFMSEAQVNTKEIETLINSLPAVIGSHVAINDWGAIEEVHVLTGIDRSPKQVVRDVESALLAKWHLRIDHKKISVAQIEENVASPIPITRLVIAEFRMDMDAIQGTATAVVKLQSSSDESTHYEGEWQGRYVPSQYHQAMAWATVEAINRVPGVDPFVLSELREESFAGKSVMLVAISRLNPRRREEMLIGAVIDRGDSQAAAVRAVLDAVNRRVTGYPEDGRGKARTREKPI